MFLLQHLMNLYLDFEPICFRRGTPISLHFEPSFFRLLKLDFSRWSTWIFNENIVNF